MIRSRNSAQVVAGEDDAEEYVCRWACNLTYKRHTLHAVMCDVREKKNGKETRFVFLTDHRPDAARALEMVNPGGRQRMITATRDSLPTPHNDSSMLVFTRSSVGFPLACGIVA